MNYPTPTCLSFNGSNEEQEEDEEINPCSHVLGKRGQRREEYSHIQWWGRHQLVVH